MAEGAPKHLGALDARLRNHCRRTGMDPLRARRHMAALVAAQMMQPAHMVSKGGRGLEFRFGISATRATRDLDGVRVGTVEETIERIATAGRKGWEGFTGTVRDRGAVEAPVPSAYQPHKLEIKLQYLGRSFDTVDIELSPEEA